MHLLPVTDYHKLQHLLKQVTFNQLFARAVIEHKVSGRVYADDIRNPAVAYIVHAYGMSLLLGDPGRIDFNRAFGAYALNKDHSRNHFEWMQAFPSAWEEVLPRLCGEKLISSGKNTDGVEQGIVELNTRVNFAFDKERYLAGRNVSVDPSVKIVRLTPELFHEMKGSVIPSVFWDSEEDFLREGTAFCLLKNGRLASTAFSSFRFDDLLELGIETLPEFRGQGLAELVCAALIDYCLEHDLNPIWACRLENTGSFKLAQKLGFVPSLYIPYYRLSR